MNPRDYESLKDAMADSPERRRVRKADKLLSSLGYTQIGRYDIANRMPGVPMTVLHGVTFIRPHYYAVITAMANVLRAYKDQKEVTPLPNLAHLRLAEFIYNAPRAWWRSLDPYRAHIMTCAEAGSDVDMGGGSYGPYGPPAGVSSNFRMGSFGQLRMTPQQPVSGASNNTGNVTIQPNPMVARNTVYQVHNPALGNAIMPAQTVNLPIVEPATARSYETPLFTWLLEFTAPIRMLL